MINIRLIIIFSLNLWESQAPKYTIDHFQYPDRPVPTKFDARTQWPYCKSIKKIIKYDNKQCKPCSTGVISLASMTTDRLCVASKGNETFEFSALDILTCCDLFPFEYVPQVTELNYVLALKCVMERPIASGGANGCKPFKQEEFEKLHSFFIDEKNRDKKPCTRKCTNTNTKKKYKKSVKDVSIFGKDDEQYNDTKQIQIEIMLNGPVVAIFDAYEDFYNYQDGVYQTNPSIKYVKKSSIPIDVKIIGWGEENKVPYWLAANFWGEDWGKLGGFFKIKRRVNLFGIEDKVFAVHFIKWANPTHADRVSGYITSSAKVQRWDEMSLIVLIQLILQILYLS